MQKDSDLRTINDTDDIDNVYLSFDVQDERYVVNSAYVTEIVELEKISRVLDVSEFIEGTISLRDRVIPVVDSRVRLGLPQREHGVRPTIIVVELNGVPTGLAVDRVTGAVSIRRENITSPPRWHGASRCSEGGPVSTVPVSVFNRMDEPEDSVSIVLDVPCLLYAQDVRLNLSQGVLMAAEEATAKGKKCESSSSFTFSNE